MELDHCPHICILETHFLDPQHLLHTADHNTPCTVGAITKTTMQWCCHTGTTEMHITVYDQIP